MDAVVDFLTRFVGSISIGIVVGSVYGLLALGIVLIYKTQRVVNFAQAEFATVAAFAYFAMADKAGLGDAKLGPVPYGVIASSVVAVSAAAFLAFVVERVVIRPLREARDVTVFVATAGVGLLIIAISLVNFDDPVVLNAPLGTGSLVTFATFTISNQQALVISVLAGTGFLLGLFFKAPVGRALLALSREPFAVRLAGIDVTKFSILTWVLAGIVAGLVGVADGPTRTLGPGLYTSVALFPALTGAVLGGLTSLPGAFVGGVAIGVAQSLASAYASDKGIPGVDTVIVFLILLGVLLFRPQGLLAKEA